MKLIILFFLVICYSSFSIAQTTQWKVVWDKNPEDDIKEYIVYRGQKEIARVKNQDTVYIDTKLNPGELYSYRIKAVNEKNISSNYSDPAKAAIPGFENLPHELGISKNTPYKLYLKDYLNDPDDTSHEVVRINKQSNSKISITLENGFLIFKTIGNWTEQDSEYVEIKVIDSHGFYNIAKLNIKDKSIAKENINIPPDDLNINIFPVEFSLNQYSEINFYNIPKNSNIYIYNSFGS